VLLKPDNFTCYRQSSKKEVVPQFENEDVGYLRTLKIARRFVPILMVSISVPLKTRLFPFVVANRHPPPFVIRSPLLAGAPLIVMLFAMLMASQKLLLT
jgi:hypothetical protein